MKWTLVFNKDKPAVGFILGIIFTLLGIYAFVVYMNAAGQRGAEVMVYIGSFAIFVGVTNNMIITIWWLRSKFGRHIDTRD